MCSSLSLEATPWTHTGGTIAECQRGLELGLCIHNFDYCPPCLEMRGSILPVRNKEPGWGRNGGKLYVWMKMERQQRWTLKEKGKVEAKVSKLPLAQRSGLPLRQYNYKVGTKRTKDLVTNFSLAIASKPFLLVASLLTKTVCLFHDGVSRQSWFQSGQPIKWYALVVSFSDVSRAEEKVGLGIVRVTSGKEKENAT